MSPKGVEEIAAFPQKVCHLFPDSWYGRDSLKIIEGELDAQFHEATAFSMFSFRNLFTSSQEPTFCKFSYFYWERPPPQDSF